MPEPERQFGKQIIPVITGEPVSTVAATAVVSIIAALGSLFGGGSSDNQKIADRVARNESVAHAAASYDDGVNQTLWSQGLKRWLPALLANIGGIIAWVRRALGPIIEAIQKLRKIIDDLFKKYVEPFLNLLQRFRRLLLILRIFHVKFADTLDRRIADLERRIAEPYLILRAKINEVVNWVNLIGHPETLLGRVPILAGIRGALGVLSQDLTGLPISFWANSDVAPSAPGSPPSDPGLLVARIARLGLE